jgi:hypothetical protein
VDERVGASQVGIRERATDAGQRSIVERDARRIVSVDERGARVHGVAGRGVRRPDAAATSGREDRDRQAKSDAHDTIVSRAFPLEQHDAERAQVAGHKTSID